MSTPALNKLRRNCLMLYVCYALSSILCFYNLTMATVCFFLLLAAYSVVNSKHKIATGTPYESHLRWLQRTFWIGSLYFMAGNIAMGIYICCFTDLGDFMTNLGGMGDLSAAQTAADNYTTQHTGMWELANIITQLPPTAWWLHRCWRGYKLLKKDLPIGNVTTWL